MTEHWHTCGDCIREWACDDDCNNPSWTLCRWCERLRSQDETIAALRGKVADLERENRRLTFGETVLPSNYWSNE